MRPIGLAILILAAGCSQAPPTHIDYVRDVEAGLDQARREGKPAALLFTADW